MDICVATDENYCGLVKVLATSIFENNRDLNITLHIFTDNVTIESKKDLLIITNRYNQSVEFYDAKQSLNRIRTEISNEWANNNSYSAYIRIFMPEMLKKDVTKYLYLDCDVIVNDSLDELFRIDLSDYDAAGVRDVLPTFYKKSIGLSDTNYFNSGVLLINAESWRKNNVGNKILSYCLENPDGLYPDQDAINVVLRERIFVLEPKYSIFYPEYSFNFNNQFKGICRDKFYYNKRQLTVAQREPVIVHYVDSVWGRPWYANNINPYSSIWIKYYYMLDEKERFIFATKHLSRNIKIFRLIYRIFPRVVFTKLYYLRRNKGLMGRIKEWRCKGDSGSVWFW